MVVIRAGKAFIPPFSSRRSLRHKIALHVEVFVDTGLSGLFCDSLLHRLEGSLSTQSIGLRNIFAFLVKDERSRLACLSTT